MNLGAFGKVKGGPRLSDEAVLLGERLIAASRLGDGGQIDLQTYLRGSYEDADIPILFDPEFYRQQVDEPFPDGVKAAFGHWLVHGVAARVAPVDWFDETHYLQKHPDVQEAGVWGFGHFVVFGALEGRSPAASFDTPSFADHLKKHLFNRGLNYIDLFAGNWLDPCDGEVYCFEADDKPIKAFLRQCAYAPYWEPLATSEEDEASDDDKLLRLAKRGQAPTPLFDPEFYRASLCERFPWMSGLAKKDLFRHWLLFGRFQKIDCTPYFDQAFYERCYADLRTYRPWTFLHFVAHGVFENRQPNEWFDAKHYFSSTGKRPGEPALLSYIMQANSDPGVTEAFHPNHLPGSLPGGGNELLNLMELQRTLRQRFESEPMKSLIEQAEWLEPKITNQAGQRTTQIPGVFHPNSQLYSLSKSVRELLDSRTFEVVVAVPHCRMSGAARVAGELTRALARKFDPSRILLLRTDGDAFQFPEWFPDQIANVDISSQLNTLLPHKQRALLVDIIRGVNAKYVVNVNSRKMWATIANYGLQLSNEVRLYSYLFCWDRNVEMKRVGYPGEFFDSTFDALSKVFVDTDYLRADLVDRHSLGPELAEKIVTLRTPSEMVPDSYTQAEARAKAVAGRSRVARRVFWAGRLDRQKRFDLVLKIAEKMPDIEFWYWGKAVLDHEDGPEIGLPNLRAMGVYNDFSEVPTDSCDVWLYTSSWDGMPTILLDIASQGIPIVCSAVEGICDLIDQSTGWPVSDVDDVGAYIDAIRDALAETDATIRKGRAVQERISRHYSQQSYRQNLFDAMEIAS